MKKFLRYHGTHRLWFPRGYKGWIMPRLDPLESCSHGANNKRTFDINEPRWMWKLRGRMFSFGGRHRCNERGPYVAGRYADDNNPMPDVWRIGTDGNRSCSCCGSMHYADMIAVCKKSLSDERYEVSTCDKNYKFYIKQPGVVNASYGAIKFYTWHRPAKVNADDAAIFANAAQLAHDRFLKVMEAMRKPQPVRQANG